MTIVISPMGVRGVLLSPHQQSLTQACLHFADTEINPMCSIDRAITLTFVLKTAGVTSVRTLNLSGSSERALCETLKRNGIRAEAHHA